MSATTEATTTTTITTGSVTLELLKEHLRIKLISRTLPEFWSHFDREGECIEKLSNINNGLKKLEIAIDLEELVSEMKQRYPPSLISSSISDCAITGKVLRLCVGVSVPRSAFPTVECLVDHALLSYERILQGPSEEEEEESNMETEGDTDSFRYWNEFQSVVANLGSLGLLEIFISHSVGLCINKKVKEYIASHCADVYDENLLPVAINNLQPLLHGWLTSIYGSVSEDYRLRILHNIYLSYGLLRIQELFDIIVEYPESRPSLLDLKDCLAHCDLRHKLMTSLQQVYKQRLLHHGANTSDIITQYISSIKGLLLLDPSGVILEYVCEPVREYLRTREDTVSCIMASLIDDSNNELAEELAKGSAMLLDLSDETDVNQDFENWEPDPIDADASKSSKSRRTSDIISILVYIYGSKELFVSEYRSLLADRLLQSLNYDTSRELRNLELLKLRFGETNLHFCEVMIKDISDSRRVNTLIHAKLKESMIPGDDGVINSFILSHIFWPSFKKEHLKMPQKIQNKLDEYSKCYEVIKGMRTLDWCYNLGLVDLELVVKGNTLKYQVSPPRASVIYQFQEKDIWTVDELSIVLDGQPSVVRRHLMYWVSQGILYEDPQDTFHVMVEDRSQHHEEIVDDDSNLTSQQEEREKSLKMIWMYVSAMLTNLGPMKLDRIHSMLRMFMTQGPSNVEITPQELKACLDKKIKSQELLYSAGLYQLNKN